MTANSLSSAFFDYVNDVKPYHVKLSSVQEQLIFNETLKVTTIDKQRGYYTFGSNILSSGSQKSWLKNYTYDGVRKSWQIPVVSANKRTLINESIQNSLKQIPGYTLGLFDPTKYSSGSIEYVKSNSTYLQDTVDYVQSQGIFSFQIYSGLKWKQYNLANFSRATKNDGPLVYEEENNFFKITNLVGGDYDEWEIKCISADSSAQTWICSVTGKYNGLMGTVSPGESFISAKISFDLEFTREFNVGDAGVFTPQSKITIKAGAPEEIWSVIKTSPLAVANRPTFSSFLTRDVDPSIIVHTMILDKNTSDDSFEVVFNTTEAYSVFKNGIPIETLVSIKDGCSYKNEEHKVHFTLIPVKDGFYPGDTFSFTTKPSPAIFKVFGSVSGWQEDAKLDEWYWNGKIGFKIPKLAYEIRYENNSLYYNENGIWESSVKTSQILNDVTFSGGNFILSGEGNIVGSSLNGKTWISGLSDIGDSDRVFTFDENGDIYRYTEADETGEKYWRKTQTFINSPIKSSVTLVNFLTLPGTSGELLDCTIAVGSGGKIVSSVDLTEFAIQISGTTQDLNDIAFSPAAIVVVGNNGTILRSLDRINWTTIPSYTSSNLTGIVYSADLNLFVIVGANGTILTSSNGLVWNNLSVFSGFNFTDIAYGNNKFVAVSGDDGVIAESNDGVNWFRYFGPALNKVTFGNGKFVGAVKISSDKQLYLDIDIHSCTEPIVYTLTFIDEENATVESSKKGYLEGLKIDTPWSDGFLSFTFNSVLLSPDKNDTFKIYLGYEDFGLFEFDYDDASYDVELYDAEDFISDSLIKPHLQSHFPFYYGKGSIIPLSAEFENFEISKISKDSLYLNIKDSSLNQSALASIDDWVPLFFKYRDTDISDANFSDLVLKLDAFMCADRNQKVFTVTQPRYKSQLYNASATITFDDSFISKFMPFGQSYQLAIKTDKTFGHIINVNITENLFINERDLIKFIQEDGIIPDKSNIISDTLLLNIHDGYANMYLAGNENVNDAVGLSIVENFKSDTQDVNNAAVSSSVLDMFTIKIRDNLNTSFVVSYQDDMVINEFADTYIVNHNLADSTPNIIIESLSNLGVYENPIGNNLTESGHVSIKSISFSIPPGFSLPFKLKLV